MTWIEITCVVVCLTLTSFQVLFFFLFRRLVKNISELIHKSEEIMKGG